MTRALESEEGDESLTDSGIGAAAESPKEDSQFSMRDMAIGMAGIAGALAPIAWLGLNGIGLSCLILLAGAIYGQWKWKGLVILGLVVGLFLFFGNAVGNVYEAAKRTDCQNRIRKLAFAIHVYHDKHGKFPPRYLVDENGKRLHSWRVLVLPELGYEELYGKIDLSKPWDDPVNAKLASQMPSIFRCPNVPIESSDCSTNYVAVYGKGTGWPDGGNPVTFNDFPDGTSQTIMLVESSSPTHWMAPDDLSVENLTAKNGDSELFYLGGHHPEGFNAVFFDSGTHFLPIKLAGDKLKAMATIAGGENVDPLDE